MYRVFGKNLTELSRAGLQFFGAVIGDVIVVRGAVARAYSRDQLIGKNFDEVWMTSPIAEVVICG